MPKWAGYVTERLFEMAEAGLLRSEFDFYREYDTVPCHAVTKLSGFFTYCGAARLNVLQLDRLTR